MGHRDPRPGDQPLDEAHERRQGLDPVVDHEDLSAPAQLALDRLLDHPGVEPADDRLDREAVGGRRLDHGQVADPRHRHRQGPGNGGRGQRQHVDGLPELLETLLVPDAEPVLLVHDQEAEVLEGDVLGEEPVGADDDVHRPRGQPGEDRLLLDGRPEAGEHLDPHGVGPEALAERVPVLLGEDGGGHEDRHLVPVEGDLEGRAHRDLGLAVAHVAADEPVHRLAPLEVRLHLANRLELVRRLLERERRFELVLPGRVGGDRAAPRRPAARHRGAGAPAPSLGGRPAPTPSSAARSWLRACRAAAPRCRSRCTW